MASPPRTRAEAKADRPDLGVLAGRLLFAVQGALFGRLAGEGFDDLRPQHGAVLAWIDAGGSRATELAQRSGQHKQVIGKLVDELEERGYVERRPDPDDRRAKLVVPTDRGLRQMARSDAIVADVERELAAALGARRYADFDAGLRDVVEAVGRVGGAR
ncbi:MarR family winged helix-turn-helix transcriptional regulator [Isoptericola sp. NPDC057191]|uniref:MarR family winged helix-turn-helix transcriptional regulator n=1 Tax=Isoptericola sp. NPDC057191 TaxID=3346041 RepID=UPI00362BC2B7